MIKEKRSARCVKRRLNRFVALFLLLLCSLPLPMTVVSLRPYEFSRSRRLDLPAAPNSMRGVFSYPGKIKFWFDQSFATRDAAAMAYGGAVTSIFNTSSNPKVAIGEEGWLYLKSEGAIDMHRRLTSMTEVELQNWLDTIDGYRKRAAAHNTAFMFVIAPNKLTIEPEYLPEVYRIGVSSDRREDLMTALNEAGVVTVDPTRLLVSHPDRLYHKTDTHWNDHGAWVATEQVLIKTAQLLNLPYISESVQIESIKTNGGDLARFLGLKLQIKEHAPVINVVDGLEAKLDSGQSLPYPEMDEKMIFRNKMTTICPNAPFPSAVIYIDSFGHVMIPHLARSFQRCTFVRGHQLDDALLETEKAAILIVQLVERKLMAPANQILR